MPSLIWICVGGALGTGARYCVTALTLSAFGSAFPYGTLAVNAIGSFLICALMRMGLSAELVSPSVRAFLATGVLGGFTTYSTFDYETFRYAQDGAYALAALNVGLTLLVCFMAGALGDGAARWLLPS